MNHRQPRPKSAHHPLHALHPLLIPAHTLLYMVQPPWLPNPHHLLHLALQNLQIRQNLSLELCHPNPQSSPSAHRQMRQNRARSPRIECRTRPVIHPHKECFSRRYHRNREPPAPGFAAPGPHPSARTRYPAGVLQTHRQRADQHPHPPPTPCVHSLRSSPSSAEDSPETEKPRSKLASTATEGSSASAAIVSVSVSPSPSAQSFAKLHLIRHHLRQRAPVHNHHLPHQPIQAARRARQSQHIPRPDIASSRIHCRIASTHRRRPIRRKAQHRCRRRLAVLRTPGRRLHHMPQPARPSRPRLQPPPPLRSPHPPAGPPPRRRPRYTTLTTSPTTGSRPAKNVTFPSSAVPVSVQSTPVPATPTSRVEVAPARRIRTPHPSRPPSGSPLPRPPTHSAAHYPPPPGCSSPAHSPPHRHTAPSPAYSKDKPGSLTSNTSQAGALTVPPPNWFTENPPDPSPIA